MLREFTGEEKSNGSLNLPASDGAPLIVVSQTGRFGGDPFENVVDEGVHDGHSLAGNSSVRVDLFQNFVDVNGEGLLPALLPLFLVSGSHGFLGLTGLLDGFSRSLGRHDISNQQTECKNRTPVAGFKGNFVLIILCPTSFHRRRTPVQSALTLSPSLTVTKHKGIIIIKIKKNILRRLWHEVCCECENGAKVFLFFLIV